MRCELRGLCLTTAMCLTLGACETMDSIGESDFVQGISRSVKNAGDWVSHKMAGTVGSADASELNEEVNDELKRGDTQGNVSESTWNNTKGDASATIKTTPVQGGQRTHRRSALKQVVMTDNLTEKFGLYQTISKANIRYGPGVRYDVAKVIDSGQRLRVVAETQGRWYMLEQEETVIGYIYAPLLTPVSTSLPYGGGESAYSQPTEAKVSGKSARVNLPYGNDAGRGVQESVRLPYGTPGDAPDKVVNLDVVETESSQITVTRRCRRVDISAKGKEGTVDDSYTACQKQDGSWKR